MGCPNGVSPKVMGSWGVVRGSRGDKGGNEISGGGPGGDRGSLKFRLGGGGLNGSWGVKGGLCGGPKGLPGV